MSNTTDPSNTTDAVVPDSASSETETHFYIAVRIFVSLLIIGGNALTLMAIKKFDYLRTTPTINFIACLSGADLLGGTIGFFILAQYLTQGNASYIPVCLVGEITNLVQASGNTWSYFFIAMDRYLYICHPYRYSQLITDRSSLYIIAALWVWITISVVIPVPLRNRLVIGMPCRFAVLVEPDLMFGLYYVQVVVLIILTVVQYLAVACVAWKQRQRIASQVTGANPEGVASKKEWKITKMMGTVLGVYLVAILPTAIVALMNNSALYQASYWVYIDRSLTILWWTNCWANPFIYAAKNVNMRRAFKSLLGMKQDNSSGEESATTQWAWQKSGQSTAGANTIEE